MSLEELLGRNVQGDRRETDMDQDMDTDTDSKTWGYFRKQLADKCHRLQMIKTKVSLVGTDEKNLGWMA